MTKNFITSHQPEPFYIFMIPFLFLTIIAAFLQATVIPLDLVSILMVWAIMAWRPGASWLAVLISGIIIDLVAGYTLGLSSVIYLVTALIWWLYQQKYQSFHPVFLFIFTSLILFIFNFITRGQTIWIQAIICGLIFTAFRKFILEFQIDNTKLRV